MLICILILIIRYYGRCWGLRREQDPVPPFMEPMGSGGVRQVNRQSPPRVESSTYR